MERILVESDTARQVIAHYLDKVQHLERACELEPDDVLTVGRHLCATRHSINTISSVKSRHGTI